MTIRKRQSRLRHGADPMQPRVFQEPPASDDPATPEPNAPAVEPGPSGAEQAPVSHPVPAGSLPVALPLHETPPPPPVPHLHPPAPPAFDSTNQLEDRLKKLEEVLKSLRAQQFTTAPLPPPQTPMFPSAEVLLSAGQMLSLANRAMQPLADPERAAAVASSLRNDGPILFEIYAEVRCMVRMFLDPRYRLSWLTRFVPMGLIGLMVFAWLSLSGMLYIGPILERVAFAVLLYLLYKVLGREAQRYRQTSPDLPASLRL